MYYPASREPPSWVHNVVSVVASAREQIDSATHTGLTSDAVLKELRPGLQGHGYKVEASKKQADRIRRPVLFGDSGSERVAYEVDGVNDELGVLLEVEAGRGAMSNAVYRNLIRSSLIVGARFLALGVMLEYRYAAGATPSYRDVHDLLDAVYASGRLALPFEGVLLFGY
ncbi:MAG TPA: hypothetical protein VMK16_08480 [Acidimicrobiales bacterium]|nr:hypothetical protein [Acidimicrobiales bacterium]